MSVCMDVWNRLQPLCNFHHIGLAKAVKKRDPTAGDVSAAPLSAD